MRQAAGKQNRALLFLRNNWLMLLIVLQPILDIVAFWTKSPNGTVAGVARLLIMAALIAVVAVLCFWLLPRRIAT